MSYPIIPGRGLNTREAKEYRVEYLKQQDIDIPLIAASRLEPDEFRHTIESYIGSVEIPVGLAGPLLFNDENRQEYLYSPVATLEGALVASMNRGAKAISESGGFKASVLHQKMNRCPMFIFSSTEECLQFKSWVDQNFTKIKEIAESYSNHALLLGIKPTITSRSVHIMFDYTTGDASGQNMTTMCTSHAITWIADQFFTDHKIKPIKYVIEGNGSSDKKISYHSIQNGRGTNVIADCFLDKTFIEKILRVSVDDFLICLDQSKIICSINGMIGYNINVANAIAAIFLATGQDMACVHESSTGILHMQKTKDGLYCSLNLPNLVVGSVGGGTHLYRQREALKMLNCAGSGKSERLVKIIAGFALSLEISTFAAIIGGQFAKVHEKLGRNKPVNWLTRAEINQDFILKNLIPPYKDQFISMHILSRQLVDNGLIITLTKLVNKKLTGFYPFELVLKIETDKTIETRMLLLKSKPLDMEVYQGLHRMAASIDPLLADLISQNKEFLEYKNCHLKELEMYQFLSSHNFKGIPDFYGSYTDREREIFTLMIELLDEQQMLLFNSENNPTLWSHEKIKTVIQTIQEAHTLLAKSLNEPTLKSITHIKPWDAKPLYSRFIQIMGTEYDESRLGNVSNTLNLFLNELEELHARVKIPKTIIHNDFNPRNVAIRQDGTACIYDWELAVYNFPHRDIVEFLSFALPADFKDYEYKQYLNYHYSLQGSGIDKKHWDQAYIYSLKEYMITRVTFYLTGKIQMDYGFAERIYLNTIRMIEILTADKN